MGYHGGHVLCSAVEIDGISILFVAAGAGLFLFEWLLRGMLCGVVLNRFSLVRRVPGGMHQACIFRTGRLIAWTDCMVFLRLQSRTFSALVIRANPHPLCFLT